MRAVVQRVRTASVRVDGVVCGQIGEGLLVFLGVAKGDTQKDVEWLAAKIAKLRIFEDEAQRMNRNISQVPDGGVLAISQFTLLGSLEKGTRPSFNAAEAPAQAKALYELFVQTLESLLNKPVPTGIFAAHMRIEADNDGPVTLIIDTRQRDF